MYMDRLMKEVYDAFLNTDGLAVLVSVRRGCSELMKEAIIVNYPDKTEVWTVNEYGSFKWFSSNKE